MSSKSSPNFLLKNYAINIVKKPLNFFHNLACNVPIKKRKQFVKGSLRVCDKIELHCGFVVSSLKKMCRVH